MIRFTNQNLFSDLFNFSNTLRKNNEFFKAYMGPNKKKTIEFFRSICGESNPLQNSYCSKQFLISTQPQQLYKTGQSKRQKGK